MQHSPQIKPQFSSSTAQIRLPYPMAAVRERRLNLTLELPSSPASSDRCPRLALQPLHPPPASASAGSEHRLSDFEKIKVLGHGNGGTVYKVRHRRSSAIYALKVLHTDSAASRREIEIHRGTDSQHIVKCHGVLSTSSGDPALLLEHMDLGSLDRRIRFPEPSLAEIAAQVLHGLSYLHTQKIVHRDVKPSNLLVKSSGEIKIGDFGVGKIMRRTLDPCVSYVGTCAYMSPERFDPDKYGGNYDAYAADVWSLGLTLLELYMGHFPMLPVGQRPDWATLMCAICFGEPPAVPEEASEELRGFIGCCLQKEAGKRWSVAQLINHPFVAGRDRGEAERVFREVVMGSQRTPGAA